MTAPATDLKEDEELLKHLASCGCPDDYARELVQEAKECHAKVIVPMVQAYCRGEFDQ